MKRASIVPCEKFELACDVFFDHPLVSRQVLEMEVSPERYAAEIAPVLSGFRYELKQMRDMGLIREGALTRQCCVSIERRCADRRPPFRRRMLPPGSGLNRRLGSSASLACA